MKNGRLKRRRRIPGWEGAGDERWHLWQIVSDGRNDFIMTESPPQTSRHLADFLRPIRFNWLTMKQPRWAADVAVRKEKRTKKTPEHSWRFPRLGVRAKKITNDESKIWDDITKLSRRIFRLWSRITPSCCCYLSLVTSTCETVKTYSYFRFLCRCYFFFSNGAKWWVTKNSDNNFTPLVFSVEKKNRKTTSA